MLERIAEIIKEKNSFAILPHVSADGDALGSSLGMAKVLEGLGKNATIILEEKPIEVLNYLPGYENIKVYDENFYGSFECVITLDTGDIQRLGKRICIFEAANDTINIDHHPTNTNFAQTNYVDEKAAATAEILWDLFHIINGSVDKDIATCLYTGLLTDTGGFRYSNTSTKTHNIAGKIIDIGVNTSKISSNIFESSTVGRLRIIGLVLNTLETYFDNKLALLITTRDMLEKANATEEDSDGLVNFARGIMGVEVGIMLKETESGTRVNFRSKEYVDVAEIACHFGGGGHKRAAGCTLDMGTEEAKEKILEKMKKVFVS